MKKLISLLVAGVMAMSVATHSEIVLNSVIANETSLAHDATYQADLLGLKAVGLTGQAVFTSASTPSPVTFQDGRQSTGSITIVDYTVLSTAAATNTVTVTSTSGLTNAAVTLPGFELKQGVDWLVAGTTVATAASLQTALQRVPNLTVSRIGAVITLTAPVGTAYNSLAIASNSGSITVASPTFTGGRNNAKVTINGIVLTQGAEWTASVSSATTATSLASAINTALGSFITATANSPTNGVIALVSDANGAAYNFSLASSVAAITLSGSSMVNGTTASYTANTPSINITAHGITLGTPVLYTGSPAISPLVAGTTYFVIPVSANVIKLASSKSNALAGTVITMGSIAPHLTASVATLSALAISGTPSFKWQSSNDAITWTDLSVASVTMLSYATPARIQSWSFFPVSYRYIRANVLGPVSGGVALQVSLRATDTPSESFNDDAKLFATGPNSPGPLSVSGSITAISFIGDGSLLTGIPTSTASVAAETAARIAADNALGVSTAALRGDLNTEIADRISGDAALAVSTTTLQSNINTEAATRAAADIDIAVSTAALRSDLATETASRISGDAALAVSTTTLQSNIDDEADARAAADTLIGVSTASLRGDLTTETSARISADDAIGASTAALDSSKLDKTGTSALSITGAAGTITTQSSVTASAFFGNGSALTNLNTVCDVGVGSDSVLCQGSGNTATNTNSVVGGGLNNTASGENSVIPGGNANIAAGEASTVGGGQSNTAAIFATVGGGLGNDASGAYSAIPGGNINDAVGSYSFAAGRRAKANTDGSYVWADSTDADFTATLADSYIIRATNGVGINTASPTTALDVVGTVTATAFAGDGSGLTGIISTTPYSVGGGAGSIVGQGDGTNTAAGAYSVSAGGFGNSAGGDYSNIGGGLTNTTSGATDAATVGGGQSNTASNSGATVSGGITNTASGLSSVVGGGESNNAVGLYSTVGGGANSSANSQDNTIAGGNSNSTTGAGATVGGGTSNTSGATYATVAGGNINSASGAYAFIGGGSGNTASGAFYSVVGGGELNTASATDSTVGGGGNNNATATEATVGGGQSNTASGTRSTVGGGTDNTALGQDSTVSGGSDSSADEVGSTVGGGASNDALAQYSVISGGNTNVIAATGDYAAISGGNLNNAPGAYATIGGGAGNTASGTFYATVAGGQLNTASGQDSTVGGGNSNEAIGISATVPGGISNVATGDYSFAAGRRAKATPNGSYVWADSTNADFTATLADSMIVRATNGVGINTATPTQSLSVSGNADVTGAVAVSTTVDANEVTQGHNLQVKSGAIIVGDNAFSSGDTYLSFKDGDGNLVGQIYVDGASKEFDIINQFNDDINIFTGSTEFYIKPSGRLGLQTSTPDTTLDVEGDAQFGTGATKSTFTANGSLLIAGSFKRLIRTKAQLDTITPEVGDEYTCSDCDVPFDVCMGTAATPSGFRAFLNSAINTTIPGTLVSKGCGSGQ